MISGGLLARFRDSTYRQLVGYHFLDHGALMAPDVTS
jgi:hypothetical protein